jgi:ribose-phosphate pyrophosphokinase
VSAIQKPLLFSGNSNIDLAREIATRMDTRLGSALVDKFKNEECRIEIKENVRGAEVFVLQSICRAPNGNSVNDSLIELLLMMDALTRASAYRITAIVPYYGYAKQDKKTKGREPISAKLVANLIEKAGTKRLVTLDLHAAQIQGFFDLPVDNLVAAPTLCSYLKAQGLEGDKIVVVSPDAGGVPRAENFAKRLRSDVAIVFKRRPEPDVSEVTTIVGDVNGKIAVVVDDMISTGGTLAKAAEALIKRGATKVVTCASHGIFAGDAVRVLTESPIERIIVTNTLPNVEATLGPKFKVLSIAQIIADAIKRITANRSVSELFAKDDEVAPIVLPEVAERPLTLPEVFTSASSATG